MTLKTYGDWFTGFGGMTLGAIDAGLNVIFGAEYDPKIAEVYRLNIGDHIGVCNLLEVDVSEFPRVDVFHASPPCPNFSNAKTNGKETDNDIALSAKVAEYIAYHLPDVFTLENVYKYRQSQSWQVIAKTLHNNSYLFNYWHVNMADYGVPQTRKRMIVIARRDGVMPQLPPATHAKEPEVGMFGGLDKWVSWYEAIEGFGLPVKEPRQGLIKLLSALPGDCILIDGQQTAPDGDRGKRRITYRLQNEPVFTITSSRESSNYLAFNGEWQSMTPRIISLFQSFPNWYKLPDNETLAIKGIGNAVPPLFASKLYKHLLRQYGG